MRDRQRRQMRFGGMSKDCVAILVVDVLEFCGTRAEWKTNRGLFFFCQPIFSAPQQLHLEIAHHPSTYVPWLVALVGIDRHRVYSV